MAEEEDWEDDWVGEPPDEGIARWACAGLVQPSSRLGGRGGGRGGGGIRTGVPKSKRRPRLRHLWRTWELVHRYRWKHALKWTRRRDLIVRGERIKIHAAAAVAAADSV